MCFWIVRHAIVVPIEWSEFRLNEKRFARRALAGQRHESFACCRFVVMAWLIGGVNGREACAHGHLD